MKVAALIPIKMDSKRVPGKNIKRFFDGTPLMYFIQQACLDAKLIDDVYVYCSEDTVVEYVNDGVNYLKRPKYLDGDDINANDIIAEFIKSVDADIYVNAHVTSPFATSETIDKCIESVMSGKYDSAFCAESIKTFLWQEGNPLNFNPDRFPRTQDLPEILGETSIAYVFTKASFLNNGRRLGKNPFICKVGRIEAMDIDYPEDFEICNAIYKEIMNNGGSDC